jgi:hypothetical protein
MALAKAGVMVLPSIIFDFSINIYIFTGIYWTIFLKYVFFPSILLGYFSRFVLVKLSVHEPNASGITHWKPPVIPPVRRCCQAPSWWLWSLGCTTFGEANSGG